MSKINYRPYGNRVIIRPVEQTEEKKIGEIIVPSVADYLQVAEVVRVGPGEYASATGVLIPNESVVGDLVFFRKEVPHISLLNGTILVRENDLEGAVENIPD